MHSSGAHGGGWIYDIMIVCQELDKAKGGFPSTPFGLPSNQLYTRITALFESPFWNPADLFSFISFHNHFKIFRYDVLLKTRVMFCPLSLLSYSKMTPELINKQSFELPFEILFYLQIELEANLLNQNVNEL